MPAHAAILYSHDADWTAPESAAEMAEYAAFSAAAGPAVTGGAALHPTSTATTVRVSGGRGGEVLVTDGPFVESKEVLAGFFLLDAADLDAAVALAVRTTGSLANAEGCALVETALRRSRLRAGPPVRGRVRSGRRASRSAAHRGRRGAASGC